MKIQVKHVVLGTHQWESCPLKEVEFLKHEHHHDFTIRVVTNVTHDNRMIEFIMLRISLMKILERYPGKYIKRFGNSSCEMLSREIAELLKIDYGQDFKVSVSEDDTYMGGEW